MTYKNCRLAQGECVLVTGANGYIASHVVDVLLENGYNVRGTVRAEMPWLNKFFTDKYGKNRFETVLVPAMEVESAFTDAVKGVAGIVHMASNLSLDPDPGAVIPRVVAGTINILKVAAKQPSVKSVVITSSCCAAYVIGSDDKAVIDESSWNDAAVEAAWSKDTLEDVRGFQVYAASKVESEREAWKWYHDNKPSFAFNTILPPFNVGPILIPEINGSTMRLTRLLLDGDDAVVKILSPQWHINVRDDARVHIAALLDPKVQSQRLFPFAKPFNWTDMIELLKKIRPGNKSLPDPPDNEGRDTMIVEPRDKAEDLIISFFGGPGYIGLEESVAAGIVDLV